MSPHPDLQRLDDRHIPHDKGEIRLFTLSRNEALRLPYFLDYYRKLGVNRFFVISNDSSDGTVDFLKTQSDVCVFHTAASFAAAESGMVWINALLDAYGVGHWTLYVDSDELLVYPRCEAAGLRQLCDWLDHRGDQGLYSLMLDMYSDGPIAAVNYRQGDNFLNACAFFDRDYHLVPRMALPVIGKPFPPLEPIGGPRFRLCFASQNTPRLWPRLKVKLLHRIIRIANKYGLLTGVQTEAPIPQAFKIPLVKWQQGMTRPTSHRTSPLRLSPLTSVVLHFKYFQDFSARVQDAVNRQNHYDGSAEYKRYAEFLSQDPDLSLKYSGSTRYHDSEGLIALRLIADDADWRRRTAQREAA